MRFPNEAELKALRERYPAGTRIRLILQSFLTMQERESGVIPQAPVSA